MQSMDPLRSGFLLMITMGKNSVIHLGLKLLNAKNKIALKSLYRPNVKKHSCIHSVSYLKLLRLIQ